LGDQQMMNPQHTSIEVIVALRAAAVTVVFAADELA